MTDYKTLKGKRIKTFATDLDNEQAEGQIFFSSSENPDKLKTAVASAAFSSTSPLLDSYYGASGAGSQTDGMVFGGISPSNTAKATTEEYNGSGFSVGGTLNTGRALIAGAGTVPAGLAFGGRTNPTTFKGETEEYNGTSWTESGDLNTSRGDMGGTGTQTAGLAVAGFSNPPNTKHGEVEEYNGTSWSEVNNYPINTYAVEGAGTQTAALMAGNFGPPYTSAPYAPNVVTEYDGTNFTVVNSMGTATYNGGMFGTQTSAVYGGGVLGNASPHAAGQKYDGTNWTTVGSLIASRNSLAAFGNSASAGGVMAGGVPVTNVAQEYNETVNTITAAAWASSGNYPTNNYGLQGAGSQTAGLAWCGDANGATTNVTAEYNGSSWTTSGNYPFSGWRIGGDGTQTAAIASGGVNNSADFQPTTNTYDGSSWTDSGNNLPANRRSHAMVGTQTSALVFGGSPTTTTLEYNGSSYSSAPALATPRAGMHALGTQTAALCGATPPNLASEEYNGSSWSTGGSQIKATGSSAEGNGTGTQTAGMFVGGYPSQATTQIYDGTIFITAPNLGSAGYGLGQSSSSSTAALAFGGYRGGYSNSTEEFTGETTSLNLKTITDS